MEPLRTQTTKYQWKLTVPYKSQQAYVGSDAAGIMDALYSCGCPVAHLHFPKYWAQFLTEEIGVAGKVGEMKYVL